MVSRITSESKVTKNTGTSKFEYSEDPLRDALRKSWGRLESTSQGRPLNVRLGRPQDIILGRPRDVRSGCPRDGQIGSLRDVLATLEGNVLGTSWGPILARWVTSADFHEYGITAKIKI